MKETMIEQSVSYTIEHQGTLYVIENVPARACKETGEQFFSPETVQHIQAFVGGASIAKRLVDR